MGLLNFIEVAHKYLQRKNITSIAIKWNEKWTTENQTGKGSACAVLIEVDVMLCFKISSFAFLFQ